MQVVLLIGRIFFVVLFLSSAIGHLTQSDMLGGYASSRGVPNGKLATQVSGVVLLLGGLSILLGIWPDLGALFIAAFTLSAAVLVHHYWSDPAEMKMQEQVQFNKDLALCGASLMLFVFFSAANHALRFQVTGSLFHVHL